MTADRREARGCFEGRFCSNGETIRRSAGYEAIKRVSDGVMFCICDKIAFPGIFGVYGVKKPESRKEEGSMSRNRFEGMKCDELQRMDEIGYEVHSRTQFCAVLWLILKTIGAMLKGDGI